MYELVLEDEPNQFSGTIVTSEIASVSGKK